MESLRLRIRAVFARFYEEPGARALAAIGATPNSITIAGFVATCAAAVVVGAGFLVIGGVVFLAASAFDMLDGALARMTGQSTRFGALLDSLFDRLGEAALFLGLAIFAVTQDPDGRNLTVFMSLLVIALASSQAVSYLRARGESLGIETREGVMTRTERVVLLGIALVLGEPVVMLAMALIGFFSIWTMITRLLRIRNELSRSG